NTARGRRDDNVFLQKSWRATWLVNVGWDSCGKENGRLCHLKRSPDRQRGRFAGNSSASHKRQLITVEVDIKKAANELIRIKSGSEGILLIKFIFARPWL